jgi:hypothetical protein
MQGRRSINTRKQLTIFGALLGVYVLLVLATYLFIPWEQLAPGQPAPEVNIPRWQLGLASAASVAFPIDE